MTEGDKVITISKFIDDHVRFNFPSTKSKLIQINRGSDTQYFDLDAVTEQRKEKYGQQQRSDHCILLSATHVLTSPSHSKRILATTTPKETNKQYQPYDVP